MHGGWKYPPNLERILITKSVKIHKLFFVKIKLLKQLRLLANGQLLFPGKIRSGFSVISVVLLIFSLQFMTVTQNGKSSANKGLLWLFLTNLMLIVEIG